MKTSHLLTLMLLLASGAPAIAGDVAKGETGFNKCKACHAIVAPDGTAVIKGGKTGPNLFGVIGRQIGAAPDYKYGDSLVTTGADGSVWDEAALAAYVADPNAWLKEKTGDPAARSKMTFKLPKGGEDLAAYLATQK